VLQKLTNSEPDKVAVSQFPPSESLASGKASIGNAHVKLLMSTGSLLSLADSMDRVMSRSETILTGDYTDAMKLTTFSVQWFPLDSGATAGAEHDRTSSWGNRNHDDSKSYQQRNSRQNGPAWHRQSSSHQHSRYDSH
jgi:hypothetical protein